MLRIIKTSYVIIILLFVSTAHSQELFDTWRSYPFGGGISLLTSADLNNDGFIDFACGGFNYDGSTIYVIKVYLNNGDGTYANPDTINVGQNLSSINYGDFNGDGWLDLAAVTGNNPRNLEIIMNQGDGSFINEQFYYGNGSVVLTSLDLNDDSYDDIIQMDYDSRIVLLLSNGDGTFATGNILSIPVGIRGTPLRWDVNNDDYTDLLIYGEKIVFTDPDSTNFYRQPIISTFINNSDTTFQPGVESLVGDSTSAGIYSLVTGFFNGDLQKDLLVTDYADGRRIYTNNGDGSFSSDLTFSKDYITQIAGGDVNGDGFSDMIYSDNQRASIVIKLNDAVNEISFTDSVIYSGKFQGNPSFRSKIICEDITNNGLSDIIQYDWTLSTIINHGDGSFPVLNMLDSMGFGASEIMFEDFNNDGFTDIFTADQGSGYIKYNDGNGNFSNRREIPGGGSNGVFLGLFNDDEFIDIALVAPGLFRFLYGQQDGSYLSGINIADTLSPFAGGYDGLAADFNEDGFMDFATYYSGSGTGLYVVLSDSNGVYHYDAYNMGSILQTDIVIGDVNNDNHLDIVTSSHNNNGAAPGGAISVRINDGSGQFPTYIFIPTELFSMGVTLQDLNNDGFYDIAATENAARDGYVSVYLNNGDSSFSDPVKYAHLYAPYYGDIQSADMDNDGDFDLLAHNSAYNEIVILFNKGNGAFPEIHYYPAGDNPAAFDLGYLDSDSTMDIAVTSSVTSLEPNRNFVFLFFNTGPVRIPTFINDSSGSEQIPANFYLYQNYPNPFNPETVIRYYLPNSGQVELTIYNMLGQKVSVLVKGKQPQGYHHVSFNGANLASGVYFYQLEFDGILQNRKMLLLK